MEYELIIPVQFLAAFAAGDVTLMETAAGATTTLMSGGQIVGTATLAAVEKVARASGAKGAAPTLRAIAVVAGVSAAIAAGVVLWRQAQARRQRDVVVKFEAEDPRDALDVLARAQAIVDAEYGHVTDGPRLQVRPVSTATALPAV